MIKVPIDFFNKLVPDDPWTYSYEGLEDSCFYCHTYNRLKHERNCAWVLGRIYLGKNLVAKTQWDDEIEHGVKS